MKISELIAALQRMMAEGGDVEVMAMDTDECGDSIERQILPEGIKFGEWLDGNYAPARKIVIL